MEKLIQMVRLKTGVDLISEIEVYDDILNLINPVMFGYVVQGSKTILMMEPWIPPGLIDDDFVSIKDSDVLFRKIITEPIRSKYEDIISQELSKKIITNVVQDEDELDEASIDDLHVLEDLDMDGYPIH